MMLYIATSVRQYLTCFQQLLKRSSQTYLHSSRAAVRKKAVLAADFLQFKLNCWPVRNLKQQCFIITTAANFLK